MSTELINLFQEAGDITEEMISMEFLSYITESLQDLKPLVSNVIVFFGIKEKKSCLQEMVIC